MKNLDDVSTKTLNRNAHGYVTRFRSLTARQGELDYDLAALARDIRKDCVAGASGDYQFRQFVVSHFKVGSATARKLLKAAHSLKLIQTRHDWANLGGWSSITFLMGLPTGGKRKVLTKALAVAAETKKPTNLDRVRKLAFDCNLRTTSTGGRPLRRETEERLEIVSHFLTRLYKVRPDLPALPAVVTKALKTARVPHEALGKIDAALPARRQNRIARPAPAQPKTIGVA